MSWLNRILGTPFPFLKMSGVPLPHLLHVSLGLGDLVQPLPGPQPARGRDGRGAGGRHLLPGVGGRGEGRRAGGPAPGLQGPGGLGAAGGLPGAASGKTAWGSGPTNNMCQNSVRQSCMIHEGPVWAQPRAARRRSAGMKRTDEDVKEADTLDEEEVKEP